MGSQDSKETGALPQASETAPSSYPPVEWEGLQPQPLWPGAPAGALRGDAIRRLPGMLSDGGDGGVSTVVTPAVPSDYECARDTTYAALEGVLNSCYEQAALGKGKERHTDGCEPFDTQWICAGQREFGVGAGLFQAVKKCREAYRMVKRGETDRATRDLRGAINYIAAAILVLEEVK